MVKIRSTILALAAVLLPLASNASKVSMEIRDATTNVKVAFLDFDGVITINSTLTDTVRDIACQGAVYPECSCEPHCNEDDYLLSILYSQTIPYEVFITAFGGFERLDALSATIASFRAVPDFIGVGLISVSPYPFDAYQWYHFLINVVQGLQLGFYEYEMVTLTNPGPGSFADKGAAIQDLMEDDFGITPDMCIYADDSIDQIISAEGICSTLYIESQGGLDDTDRAYLETLVHGYFPLGTVPPSCEPEGLYVEIVTSDKACGQRTHIGKADDATTCGELVVGDKRCTNKDYFMYRAANDACHCIGVEGDCSDDLHTVSGLHIYSINYETTTTTTTTEPGRRLESPFLV